MRSFTMGRIQDGAFARLLLASAVLAIGQAAMAQAAAKPVGVRGTISAVSADSLKVHTSRGEDLAIHLGQDTTVRGVTLAQVGDIKPGSYIGTAAMPQPDGTLKALEIHVFPPEMAGTGDGHRPWDLEKNSTMTNGSVGSVVAGAGRTLTVQYKGGEKKVVVPDDVPIVNLVPGDRSLLAPGVKVVLFAKKEADASLTALAISAGKNGVTPPM
jgi:hypothetical protein